jgi:transposase InsO family protein
MTTTVSTEEGQVHVFIAVDHFTAECIGIHAAKSGNRFEALEPIRQGAREHFGGFERGIATGLSIRHDHGSASMSDDFPRELAFLGMTSSPSFVREPEGNDIAERFIRTFEREPPLGAVLRHRRGAGRGPPGVQAALQRAVADRASRLPHAEPGEDRVPGRVEVLGGRAGVS